MDSLGLYEDLSLFNGDLQLPGFTLLAADEEPFKDLLQVQDGISTNKSGMTEAPITKPSAKVILGHPQQGSSDLGLADLLASSPTKGLPDPLESAWMDTKMDLVDLLTSESPAIEQPQLASPASRPLTLQLSLPQPPPAAISPGAVVPSTSAPPTPDPPTMEGSLDILQDLLSADIKVDSLPQIVVLPPEDVKEPIAAAVYEPDQLDCNVYEQGDQLDLMDLDTSGLEELLATDLDASITDAGPILSPVSADEVESILSSSPPSPGNGLTNFIDTLDTNGHNTSQCDSAYASLNSSLVSEAANTSSEQALEEFDTSLLDAAMSPAPGPEHITAKSLRSEPYAKPTGRRARNADRKERKKEQNRSAALRYRHKKKEEQCTVEQECEKLQEKNTELKDKVDSISREINYLKDLLAEVYKAKGLVPKKSISKILKKK